MTALRTQAARGLSRRAWAVMVTVIAVLAIGGTAFAVGRGTAPASQPIAGTHAGQAAAWASRHPADIAWMRSHRNQMTWLRGHPAAYGWMAMHPGDIGWMRQHPGQWQWIRDHHGQWAWIQAHPAAWAWMHEHMGDIGWMHDNWRQWQQWRSAGTSQHASGHRDRGWCDSWMMCR
jgi:hypothetical protein